MIPPNTAKKTQTIKIALVCTLVSLFVAAFFTARQELRSDMAVVSSFAIIGFALPACIAIIQLLGKKIGLILLVLLGAYALAIETSALQTGFPYGSFIYRDLLGTKLFDVTPWTVAFAYPPILLFAYWLVRQFSNKASFTVTVVTTGVIAMVCDLILDPAAVGLGFWYWPGGGFFYDVPLVNFIGWIFSSTLGAIIVHAFLRSHKQLPYLLPISGLLILFFWVSVNLWLGNTIPVIIGVIIIYSAVKLLRLRTYNQTKASNYAK